MRFICKECGYIYEGETPPNPCPVCKFSNTLVDEDMDVLRQLNCSQQLIDVMQKLRESDIIEYELKMSQFHTQYEQQQSIKKTQSQQFDNRPKCPTCGSTNIRKISASAKMAGAIGFGLFSKTARSQFECLDCKYKW